MKTTTGRARHAVLAAVIAVSGLFPLHAQHWQPAGLENQDVGSIAASATGRLYAGTPQGLFRAHNDDVWTNVLPLSLNQAYWDIAADADGAVYAVSGISVFAWSTDRGDTWSTLSQGQILQHFGVIKSLATAPDGTVYIGTTNAVYRSDNRGDNWTTVTHGLPANFPDVQDFAVTPDGVVYAGTGGIVGGHIYGSADRGGSWTQVYSGVLNQDITALAAPDNTILAGVVSRGVLRSTDEGTEWNTVAVEGAEGMFASEFAVGVSAVYALIDSRVYSSIDNGATWTALPAPAQVTVRDIAVASDGTLYAATSSGVYEYTQTTDVPVPDNAFHGPVLAPTAYPNPSARSVTIAFTLAGSGHVRVELRDMFGRPIAVPLAQELPPGRHSAVWNASGVGPGTYYYSITTGRYTTTGMVVLTGR